MSEETVARQATLTEQLSLLTEHLFSMAMEPHTPSSPFSPHTMSFGESPDESIEEGLDMMLEMIGHKCSICFVEDSALELPGCGDQFCIECLDHYWTVKLEDGGWGIRPVPIDCPVCRAKVDVESLGWELWASDNLLLLYRRNINDRPLLTRCCRTCSHEQSYVPSQSPQETSGTLLALVSQLLRSNYLSSHQVDTIIDSIIDKDYAQILADLSSPEDSLKIKYREGSKQKKLEEFVRLLVFAIFNRTSSPLDFDILADAQIAAVSVCPIITCDQCLYNICMRCGENTTHSECTPVGDVEVPSKFCPKCYVTVIKDETEGGCNEMRCSRCGHVYCWNCLGDWGNCGYYSCVASSLSSNSIIDKVDIESSSDYSFRIESAVELITADGSQMIDSSPNSKDSPLPIPNPLLDHWQKPQKNDSNFKDEILENANNAEHSSPLPPLESIRKDNPKSSNDFVSLASNEISLVTTSELSINSSSVEKVPSSEFQRYNSSSVTLATDLNSNTNELTNNSISEPSPINNNQMKKYSTENLVPSESIERSTSQTHQTRPKEQVPVSDVQGSSIVTNLLSNDLGNNENKTSLNQILQLEHKNRMGPPQKEPKTTKTAKSSSRTPEPGVPDVDKIFSAASHIWFV